MEATSRSTSNDSGADDSGCQLVLSLKLTFLSSFSREFLRRGQRVRELSAKSGAATRFDPFGPETEAGIMPMDRSTRSKW